MISESTLNERDAVYEVARREDRADADSYFNAALRQTLSPTRTPCGSLRVQIAGETCVLRCSGALWRPAHRTLVAADLHLEKGSAFAAPHRRSRLVGR